MPGNTTPPFQDNNEGNEDPINLNDYYSLREVRAKFGVTYKTIYNWRKAKKLLSRKKDKRVLFLKSHIDEALERYLRMGYL